MVPECLWKSVVSDQRGYEHHQWSTNREKVIHLPMNTREFRSRFQWDFGKISKISRFQWVHTKPTGVKVMAG